MGEERSKSDVPEPVDNIADAYKRGHLPARTFDYKASNVAILVGIIGVAGSIYQRNAIMVDCEILPYTPYSWYVKALALILQIIHHRLAPTMDSRLRTMVAVFLFVGSSALFTSIQVKC